MYVDEVSDNYFFPSPALLLIWLWWSIEPIETLWFRIVGEVRGQSDDPGLAKEEGGVVAAGGECQFFHRIKIFKGFRRGTLIHYKRTANLICRIKLNSMWTLDILYAAH